MILFSISLLLFGCSNAPEFPRGEVKALNKQYETIRVFMTPADPEKPPVFLREEVLNMQNLPDVGISYEYYMELQDYKKNMIKWGKAHCK